MNTQPPKASCADHDVDGSHMNHELHIELLLEIERSQEKKFYAKEAKVHTIQISHKLMLR